MQDLIKQAVNAANKSRHSDRPEIGEVGCALLAANGKIYTGVSLVADSAVGFCAEVGAISAMLADGETRITKIVAAGGDGTVLPPCGKCRELIYSTNPNNIEADVIVDSDRVVKFKDLLPEIWQNRINNNT